MVQKKKKAWKAMEETSTLVGSVINASAAVTLLEQRPEKIQALSGIRTHDLCVAGAVLYQWAIKATWERSYPG